jgi:hypothetical protein
MAIDQNIGAQSYIRILETLRDTLLSNNNITTVTSGDITDIDLDKQTLFPLAHIVIGNANFQSTIITYQVSVLIMDIVHDDITENEPNIYQDDNSIYVLNNMLNIGNHLTDSLFTGDLYDGNLSVDKSTVSAEPFSDRFENLLAGWSFNFQLTVRNNINRCN